MSLSYWHGFHYLFFVFCGLSSLVGSYHDLGSFVSTNEVKGGYRLVFRVYFIVFGVIYYIIRYFNTVEKVKSCFLLFVFCVSGIPSSG